MNVAIITFSPSGNTAQIGELLKSQLEKSNIQVQHLNATKDRDIFDNNDYAAFFNKKLEPHDLLCLGAPVYAHHYHYHMLELIKKLPQTGSKFGRYAMPFITYGHIESGIALEEAATQLKKSGRTVIAGMKISARHTMLETLLHREIGTPSPITEISKTILEATKRISMLTPDDKIQSKSFSLKYKPIHKKLIAKTIFNEKLCHNKFYPTITIDNTRCVECGICINKCPTNHLQSQDNSNITRDRNKPCIHCFNCIRHCPQKAITLNKDTKVLEKILKFLTRNGFERPANSVFPANNSITQ